MPYVEQSSSSLILYVGESFLEDNIEKFTVIKTGSVSVGGITVKAFILGESHALSIRCDYTNKVFDEICACTDVHLEAEKMSLGKVDSYDYLSFENGHSYSFRRAYLNSSQVTSFCENLRENRDMYTLVLEHVFHSGEDNCNDLDPVTIVAIKIDATKVRVQSLHVYPEEETGVYTESEYTLIGSIA